MILRTLLYLLPSLIAAQMIGRYSGSHEQNSSVISIVNGRIFTPGLAIIASPQPNTPMGGDFLHIAVDISGDGALPFPPSSNPSASTRFHNIILFLTSTTLGKNFTISNGTTRTPPLSNILEQETGSTVKHVNFEWPRCLIGDGQDAKSTARGAYNISIHQSFRLNGSDFYTIFNLPLEVTNRIEEFPGAQQLLTDPRPGPLSTNGGRMECGALENKVLVEDELSGSVRNPESQPFGESGKLDVGDTGNGDGQIGGSSSGSNNDQSGVLGAGSAERVEVVWTMMLAALVAWLYW